MTGADALLLPKGVREHAFLSTGYTERVSYANSPHCATR
jgi:hypothetical protein